MGNLLGEPFDEYVNDQISARQRLHGKSNRSTRDLQYLNSRNAWIKLASSCLLDQNRLDLLKGNPLITSEGESTAKNNILFNGLSRSNGSQRSGITGNNRAYGVGGTSQFGYSPMPGIIDMDFKCLNRGSIKKATLNIKAHNKNQFDMIDVLYLRLGYSVMLEWGYDRYINNKGRVIQQGPTLIDEWFFKTPPYSQNYRNAILKIQKKRKETFGNYDAAFGVISNFSWTFETDGTYNIKLEIISMGDVIESLRMNLPSTILDNSSGPGGQNAVKRYASLLESDGANTVSQDNFYNILYPGLKTALRNWWFGVQDGTYSTGISGKSKMTLPNINAGKSFLNNWTGRDDVGDDPTYDENKTYGSSWVYANASQVPKLYNSNGTLYTNPDVGQIDDGFKFNDEKLKAVWAGVNRVWKAGIITSDNDNRPKEDIDSPFGDDFVRNMRGPLKDLDVPDNNDRQDSTNNDSYFMWHYIPYPVNGQYSDTMDNLELVYFRWPGRGGWTNGNSVRETWTKLFNTKIKKNEDKWKFLLDNEYKGINFSNQIGISLNGLYKAVYDEFSDRKLADAFPKSPVEQEELDKIEAIEEEGGELTDAQERNKELTKQRLERVTKDYVTKNRNRIYRTFYDLRQTYSKSKEKNVLSLFPGEVNGSKGDIGLGFRANNIVKLNVEPLDNQWYIRLGYFLEILNNNFIPKVTNGNSKIPMIIVDTDVKTNICYTIDNAYSLNLKKILVQNSKFSTGKTILGVPVSSPIFPKLPEFVHTEGDLTWGNIMNIYFNFNRLEEIFDSTVANDEVSLYTALKTICDDINECLGDINKLEPIVDEENLVKFIDQASIPNIEKIAVKLGLDKFGEDYKRKEVKFEVYGLNYNKPSTESNFVRNIGLTTQISKNYATMITVGATANGSVPGTEATAFSRWNIGIHDRFKEQIDDPEERDKPEAPISSSTGQQIVTEYSKMIASEDDVFNRYGLTETSDDLKTVNDGFIKYNTSTSSDFYKLIQAQSSFEKDENNKPKNAIESSVGFIPFNLKLEIDGLSGVKIYNRIQVVQNFLPSNYDNTLEFIITQVNHRLRNNDWITELETTATSKSVMAK